jgi:transcriptional regulator with XRE-family HTH domain
MKRKQTNTETLEAFGLNLRQIRKEKKITQKQLALSSKIDIRQIGAIERGEINTGLINIMKIAKALQVHPNELLNLENK